MTALWPWLAIAGLGALHGLGPASGWPLAAACGVHARDAAQARRALGPIAVGQVASMAMLAGAFSLGVPVDRALMRDLAVALLIGAALWLALRRGRPRMRSAASARVAGVALGSFLMASAQGAGLMLIPALVPLCANGAAAREATTSGSLAAALAALAVHTAAMLLTAGLVATGACRVAAAVGRRTALTRGAAAS